MLKDREYSYFNQAVYQLIAEAVPITKKAVEALDGRIQLESELGEGATFTIYLPVEMSAKN